MRLTQSVKGTSKLVMLILLIISFLLGAILSYIWTMGFYAPSEFNLPSQTNVTIENVHFPPEDASSFNITVLNPSYSPSNASIERIRVLTNGDKVHYVDSTAPALPLSIAPSKSQTIKSFWNWGNYTGQTVDVYVVIAEGPRPGVQARTPFMNFSIASVNIDPSVSVNHFNITVQNVGSSTSVNITRILVNGVQVSTEPNTLITPYGLTNASGVQPTLFMLLKNWTDLQGKPITIEVQTVQGFSAYYTVVAPTPMILSITEIDFNINYTDRFNVTVQNAESSAPYFVDIDEVKLLIGNETFVPTVSLPQKLEWNQSVTLACFWNWSSYEGRDATFVIQTVQGFTLRNSTSIIPKPKVSFIRWADSARVNTFDYSIDVAPSIKITNENITHGIWNWDKTARTTRVRISNIINSSYLQNITIYVKLGSETVATIFWNSSDSLPTSWVSFSAIASTKYSMGIEIATTPEAVSGQTSVVTLEIETPDQ